MAGVLGQFHGFMLVLAYAALGCVWMILAYATFASVTMGSGPRGCCGGPTISYSTEGISSFFLESLTQTAITTTTVVIRNATARRTPSGNPTRSPIMLVGVSMEGNVEVAVGEKGDRICQAIIVIVLLTRQMIIISVVSLIMSDSHQEQEQAM